MQAKLFILRDIKEIISVSKDKAIRAVDNERVLMYWSIGKRILEEEQDGKERAVYGEYLIKTLAEQLEPEYGSGFSIRQLELCRQFYRTLPITNAPRSQFSRTHYRYNILFNTEYIIKPNTFV